MERILYFRYTAKPISMVSLGGKMVSRQLAKSHECKTGREFQLMSTKTRKGAQILDIAIVVVLYLLHTTKAGKIRTTLLVPCNQSQRFVHQSSLNIALQKGSQRWVQKH